MKGTVNRTGSKCSRQLYRLAGWRLSCKRRKTARVHTEEWRRSFDWDARIGARFEMKQDIQSDVWRQRDPLHESARHPPRRPAAIFWSVEAPGLPDAQRMQRASGTGAGLFRAVIGTKGHPRSVNGCRAACWNVDPLCCCNISTGWWMYTPFRPDALTASMRHPVDRRCILASTRRAHARLVAVMARELR